MRHNIEQGQDISAGASEHDNESSQVHEQAPPPMKHPDEPRRVDSRGYHEKESKGPDSP